MDALAVAGIALVVAVVVVGVLAVLLARAGRDRAATRDQLASARAETASLHRRLDEVSERLARLHPSADRATTSATAAAAAAERSYLITDVGSGPAGQVPDRVVLSAAVGEPLVRAAALAHGVRRALAPASRNRILFEMRREVRRARKERRKQTREAWRRSQAQQRATEGAV